MFVEGNLMNWVCREFVNSPITTKVWRFWIRIQLTEFDPTHFFSKTKIRVNQWVYKLPGYFGCKVPHSPWKILRSKNFTFRQTKLSSTQERLYVSVVWSYQWSVCRKCHSQIFFRQVLLVRHKIIVLFINRRDIKLCPNKEA